MKIDKLTLKITLIFVGLIVIAFAVISLVLVNSEKKKYSDDVRINGMVFAEFSAETIYDDYVWLYRHAVSEDLFIRFMNNLEGTMQKNGDAVEVSLISTSGKVMFTSDDTYEDTFNSSRFIDDPDILLMMQKEEITYRNSKYEKKDAIEVIVPLKEESGTHIMCMKYVFVYKSMEKRMSEIYTEILLITVPSLIISIILVILFSVSLARPIIVLKEYTQKIAGGDLNTRVHIKNKDEIGDLAEAFNHMAEELKKSHEQLEKYSDDLEVKVEERTKELHQKIDELEKFNKLTLDRELKMVELKNQIKILEDKLEKK